MDQHQPVLQNHHGQIGGGGTGWAPGVSPQIQMVVDQAMADPNAIVEEIPSESDALSWFSVACLTFNRMIGSGIFTATSVIFFNTQSIGVGLLLWLCGAVLALSGIVLYIDLGLSIPKWVQPDGSLITTIRSGGELPYLNHFLRAPRFLVTCLFGVSFLVFGNTATNSVAFSVAVLKASGAELTAGKVVAIGLAVNTFSCLLHSMSRKWGIRLNNLLGGMKLLMLILMVIFGLRWLDKDVARDNLSPKAAFATTEKGPTGAYRYGEALVYAIFPFGGFHQANYVLAEIRQPQRYFARSSGFAVLLICCLYMVLATLYAAIIPKARFFDEPNLDVTQEFFERTIGSGSVNANSVVKANHGLRALSAIGNVIVFTFTAARVKQEVAKEGIFPFSKYFAASYEFSFRRGFRRLPSHTVHGFLHTEKAPAAALALHWTVTSVLILAAVLGTGHNEPAGTFSHLPGYSLLLMAYAYGLDVIWFTCIGAGMLYLLFRHGSEWRHDSPFPHIVAIIAAVVFTAVNTVPLVTIWIYDPVHKYIAHSDEKVAWFAPQTTSMAVMAVAFVYWVGFRTYLSRQRTRHGLVWEVIRIPIFWRAPQAEVQGGDQRLVQIYEIIRLKWTAWAKAEQQQGEEHELGEVAYPHGHGGVEQQQLMHHGGGYMGPGGSGGGFVGQGHQGHGLGQAY